MTQRRLLFSFAYLALAILLVLSIVFPFLIKPEVVARIDRSILEKRESPNEMLDTPLTASSDSPRSLALKPAPDPRLIEKSGNYMLPRIAENGDRAAEIYARPYDVARATNANRPKLSIVIYRAGIGETMTAETYLALPPAVSFAISPYASDPDRQIRDIRNHGHEVFLEVLVKADKTKREDRGPLALDPDAGNEINRDRLYKKMSRFSGYAGLLGDVTSAIKPNGSALSLMISEAKSRGLFFAGLNRTEMRAGSLIHGSTRTDSSSLAFIILD